MLAGTSGAHALLSLVTDRVDAELLDQAPELRVVANMAVGYDNIDVAAARERGVVVTNTPDVLTETTADLAFALVLATARRVVEGDRWVRSGDWPGWGPLQLLGRDVHGSTLGIVGFGRIGRAVARRARGFSMPVLYWNRTRLPPEEERRLDVAFCELDALLERADFVSLHAAYNEDTHHLLDRERLARMKPTAYLINTARGPVVDERALIDVLEEGGLAGAGLDVFEREPEVPAALRQRDDTVLLPHLGSASEATRLRMAEMAVQNIQAVLGGMAAPNQVS